MRTQPSKAARRQHAFHRSRQARATVSYSVRSTVAGWVRAADRAGMAAIALASTRTAGNAVSLVPAPIRTRVCSAITPADRRGPGDLTRLAAAAIGKRQARGAATRARHARRPAFEPRRARVCPGAREVGAAAAARPTESVFLLISGSWDRCAAGSAPRSRVSRPATGGRRPAMSSRACRRGLEISRMDAAAGAVPGGPAEAVRRR